jgi:hypothetical protein
MEAPHHFIAILGKTGNPQSARVPSIVGRRLGRTHEHRRRVPCETAIEYRAAGNPDAKLAPRRGAGSASRWVCCVKWASAMAGADQLAGRTTPSYRETLKFRPTLTADPRVSLLFMTPGVGNKLRVNGCAEIHTDAALCAEFEMQAGCQYGSINHRSVYFQCKGARALSVLERGCASSSLGAAFDRRRNQEMRCLFRSSVKLSRTAGRMERLAL